MDENTLKKRLRILISEFDTELPSSVFQDVLQTVNGDLDKAREQLKAMGMHSKTELGLPVRNSGDSVKPPIAGRTFSQTAVTRGRVWRSGVRTQSMSSRGERAEGPVASRASNISTSVLSNSCISVAPVPIFDEHESLLRNRYRSGLQHGSNSTKPKVLSKWESAPVHHTQSSSSVDESKKFPSIHESAQDNTDEINQSGSKSSPDKMFEELSSMYTSIEYSLILCALETAQTLVGQNNSDRLLEIAHEVLYELCPGAVLDRLNKMRVAESGKEGESKSAKMNANLHKSKEYEVNDSALRLLMRDLSLEQRCVGIEEDWEDREAYEFEEPLNRNSKMSHASTHTIRANNTKPTAHLPSTKGSKKQNLAKGQSSKAVSTAGIYTVESAAMRLHLGNIMQQFPSVDESIIRELLHGSHGNSDAVVARLLEAFPDAKVPIAQASPLVSLGVDDENKDETEASPTDKNITEFDRYEELINQARSISTATDQQLTELVQDVLTGIQNPSKSYVEGLHRQARRARENSNKEHAHRISLIRSVSGVSAHQSPSKILIAEKADRAWTVCEVAALRAAVYVFRTKNCNEEGGIDVTRQVDLHGLHLDEAVRFVSLLVNRYHGKKGPTKSSASKQLRIIVGSGKHSKDGVAKLKPAIVRFCDTYGLSYTDQGPCIVIKMY